MVTCHNPEPIPLRLGGGHLCTCPSGGKPHLHGGVWSTFRCPVCVPGRAGTRARLQAAQAARDAIYYPQGGR